MAHILISEDNPILRATLARTLEALGHTVVVAADGIEAETATCREPVDLVLTDLIMPDRDGLELIQVLKRYRPELPIIAMSGGGRAKAFELSELARDLGADASLRKPFKRAVLIEAIDALLQRARTARAATAAATPAPPSSPVTTDDEV